MSENQRMKDHRTKVEEKIIDCLREQFPQIRMHGGIAAIQDIDIEEKRVWLLLGGECHGCGISSMTAEALRNNLPQHIDEIDNVEVVFTEELDHHHF